MKKTFVFILLLAGGAMWTANYCQAQACANTDTIISINFGKGAVADLATAVPGATTTYTYDANCPENGLYKISGSVPFCFSGFWHTGATDHTGDSSGRMMIVNAGVANSIFYHQTISGLAMGVSYNFSVWIANLVDPLSSYCGPKIVPHVNIDILDSASQALVGNINTGDISATNTMTWNLFSAQFTSLSNSVTLVMKDIGSGGCGNDLALDDIMISACPPELSINDVSIAEGNLGTKAMKFKLSLNRPSAKPVSVNVKTLDGTAIAGVDYVAKKGVVTLNPGVTSSAYKVTINGDTLVEPKERFYVGLKNPVNAIIIDSSGVGTIQNDDGLFPELNAENGIKIISTVHIPTVLHRNEIWKITGLAHYNSITITNINGQTVFKTVDYQSNHSFNELSSGIYFYEVITGEKEGPQIIRGRLLLTD